MKKLLLIPFLFVTTLANATQISYGTNWAPQGQVTNVNLNGNFANVSSVVNGKLDNTNSDTTNGYRFYQTVAVLPSPGNQGAVYFLTSDNSLNFDNGSSFSKSVAIAGTPAQGDVAYYGASGWTKISAGTAGYVLQTNGVAANPTWVAGIPTGAILAWSGSVGSIPSGYHLCDGTNGTPNLQDKFIIGAGNSYAVGATGGATTTTLTAANIPPLPLSYGTSTGPGGGTTAAYTLNEAPAGTTNLVNSGVTASAFSILPPYYALCYIMKL